MLAQIEELKQQLKLANERLESSSGELGKELERLRLELETRTKKFQADFEDMQTRLKQQKDQELKEMREKYERMMEELKRNAANDRDFLKKEMERKIADLEKEI